MMPLLTYFDDLRVGKLYDGFPYKMYTKKIISCRKRISSRDNMNMTLKLVFSLLLFLLLLLHHGWRGDQDLGSCKVMRPMESMGMGPQRKGDSSAPSPGGVDCGLPGPLSGHHHPINNSQSMTAVDHRNATDTARSPHAQRCCRLAK
jgi:hypothetical protein